MNDAYIVVDLGFGDAGKGSIVDWLARRHPDATVVRHNGGAQAAHNVVTTKGDHHTFAQFGSGHLAGARTHLSRFMMINPANMLHEARFLARVTGEGAVFSRVTVDPRALITTRLHMAYNRVLEMSRGTHRHGSCGQGIGATVEYSLTNDPLRALDLTDLDLTVDKLRALQQWVLDRIPATGSAHPTYDDELRLIRELDLAATASTYQSWATLVRRRRWQYDEELDGTLIFEGAQGVLLDENHGTAPYHTWSTTTDRNARLILAGLDRDGQCIGVTRSYMTRHGAGPFPSEDALVTAGKPEVHNTAGQYQGVWRCGKLDLPLLRYAVDCCDRVDALAVTHMDRVPELGWPVVAGYTRTGRHVTRVDMAHLEEYIPVLELWEAARYDTRVAGELGVPLLVSSWGPTAADKLEYAHA